jgi:hypothetical protein
VSSTGPQRPMVPVVEDDLGTGYLVRQLLESEEIEVIAETGDRRMSDSWAP